MIQSSLIDSTDVSVREGVLWDSLRVWLLWILKGTYKPDRDKDISLSPALRPFSLTPSTPRTVYVSSKISKFPIWDGKEFLTSCLWGERINSLARHKKVHIWCAPPLLFLFHVPHEPLLSWAHHFLAMPCHSILPLCLECIPYLLPLPLYPHSLCLSFNFKALVKCLLKVSPCLPQTLMAVP